MTCLYINISYTSPYFHRHQYNLIHQKKVLWSKHSCWVPYFVWKDVFQTLIPIELEYNHIEQLQRDNTHHFRNMYKLLSPPSVKVPLAKQSLCITHVPIILIIIIVLLSLYHIIQTFL
jgi:hypothetical protein